jgi:histone-lysine N-methyltransferase SETMAR
MQRPNITKINFTLKLIWPTNGTLVLPHPEYSPDLAPSTYHLFRSTEHYLREKIYENGEDIRKDTDEFFPSKDASFYHQGIEQLPARWQKVIDSNGMCFDF